MLHLVHRWRVDRAFSDGLAPAPAAAMRVHLGRCEDCRRRYQRQLLAEAALPDGASHAADRLWEEIRQVAATPAAPPVSAGWRPWWPAAAVAVALVLVAPVLLTGRRQSTQAPAEPPAAPLARGSAVPQAGLAPALHVFRATGGVADPVTDRIRSSDGLLFAYSNPGAGYSHLMVFAVDARHQVYWFYPAYQRADENPEAIGIQPGRSGVELAEEIRQPFAPGPVRLFALFLDRPERVLAVEGAVARAYRNASPAEDRPLGLPGARQESRLLRVER